MASILTPSGEQNELLASEVAAWRAADGTGFGSIQGGLRVASRGSERNSERDEKGKCASGLCKKHHRAESAAPSPLRLFIASLSTLQFSLFYSF